MSKGPKRKPIEERFWSRVKKTDTCWLWTGRARAGFGYGMLGRGGRQAGMVGAHRVSWEIHEGPIPDGMSVLHRCDNPACVNPAHLFLGTQTDNMADAWSKGRRRVPPSQGERNGRARLTVVDAALIRAAYKRGMTQTALAGRFGVPQTHISRIVRNKAWAV